MPSRLLPCALSVLLLSGCAAALPSLKPYAPDVPPRGVVFAVDGAGGYGGTVDSLSRAVADEGLPLYVQPVIWSHGYRRILADVVDSDYLDRQGCRLAAEVRAWREARPGLPVYVVAHSAGCGVALKAAEALPADSVERLILIAPAVSAHHDLRPALRACRAVEVFHSDRDWVSLRLGTALIGNADRTRDAAAGRVGFGPACGTPADAALLARLRQHPWDPVVAWTGNRGGHADAYRPEFLRAYVLPLLTPATTP